MLDFVINGVITQSPYNDENFKDRLCQNLH